MLQKFAETTNNIVIKVDGVSKTFKLPHERETSVKNKVIAGFRRYKDYDTQTALKNINFEVKKGEFFGIVGRNGSGKSTLLKMLAKIYQPTTGKIHTTGKLVPFIELGVGFNPELSGRDNVYLNGAMLNFSVEEVDEFYGEVVEFAELEKFMDQKLKNYSSGMQVRLAFSMAIRAKADILLIDEVLAVGDADFQRKCFEYFKELKKNNKTVVFVSHDMTAIREYCDRAVMIEESQLAYTGSPEKVASCYTELFLKTSHTQKTTSAYTQRWGEGKIKYINTSLKIESSKGKVTVYSTVRSHSKQKLSFFLGFRIRNQAGQDILGVNTRLMGIKDGSIEPNEKYGFKWEFPNMLADGKYNLVCSVSLDNSTIQDYIELSNLFTIRKSIVTRYLTQPNIKFTKLDKLE